MTDSYWTETAVKARLEEAAETLKALRLGARDWPSRLAARWPDVVRSTWDAYGYTAVRMRPPVPSPQRISRADAAVQWLLWVSDEERRILWGRASRIPWRRLEDLDGRSHTTLRKIQAGGLARIARRLNAEGAAGGHRTGTGDEDRLISS